MLGKRCQRIRTLHVFFVCVVVGLRCLFQYVHSLCHQRLGMLLFIQMQLCTTTLRDWLVKRNEDISHTTGKYQGKEFVSIGSISLNVLFLPFLSDGQVDKSAVVEIFRQVVEGVSYIHSQALLHRDLKVTASASDIAITKCVPSVRFYSFISTSSFSLSFPQRSNDEASGQVRVERSVAFICYAIAFTRD